jgi:hypothetical protein
MAPAQILDKTPPTLMEMFCAAETGADARYHTLLLMPTLETELTWMKPDPA